MDRETQKRFAKLWNARPKIRLEDIAAELGYSFQSLAKWRMILGLPRRYGADDAGRDSPAMPAAADQLDANRTPPAVAGTAAHHLREHVDL
jgi:hypothetical protein